MVTGYWIVISLLLIYAQKINSMPLEFLPPTAHTLTNQLT